MIIIKCFIDGNFNGYLSSDRYYETDFNNPKIFNDLNYAYDVIDSILDRTDFDECEVSYELIGVELKPIKKYIPQFNWMTPKEERTFKEEKIKE